MKIELPPAPRDAPVELFLLAPRHVGDAYVSWLNAPEVNRFLESRFGEHSLESTRAYVATMLDSPQYLFLGIRLRASGRHVGNIKLGPVDRQHATADVGILVGDQAAWGKGVATSAIVQACAIARDCLQLRKLTAGCYASNVGSSRAFEKAGFTIEGTRPQQFLLDGRPEDGVLMGRLLG